MEFIVHKPWTCGEDCGAMGGWHLATWYWCPDDDVYYEAPYSPDGDLECISEEEVPTEEECLEGIMEYEDWAYCSGLDPLDIFYTRKARVEVAHYVLDVQIGKNEDHGFYYYVAGWKRGRRGPMLDPSLHPMPTELCNYVGIDRAEGEWVINQTYYKRTAVSLDRWREMVDEDPISRWGEGHMHVRLNKASAETEALRRKRVRESIKKRRAERAGRARMIEESHTNRMESKP